MITQSPVNTHFKKKIILKIHSSQIDVLSLEMYMARESYRAQQSKRIKHKHKQTISAVAKKHTHIHKKHVFGVFSLSGRTRQVC